MNAPESSGAGTSIQAVWRRAVAARPDNLIVYVGFLLIVAFFAITLQDRGFLTPDNFANIARQTAMVSIMAFGMTFVLSAGEIDLSIGSIVALSAMVVAAPTMVHADIGLMQRVLENLLRNALKFTPAGGDVTINLDPRPGAVCVVVSDTGCGIAEEDLERIFDRFYHSGTKKSEQDTSTGLGLAIVKRILDLHGSRITVTSSVNQGTRFEFDLPIAEAA